MSCLYALHDYDETKKGCMFPISIKEAKKYNEQGYGIHWMPQDFKGTSRKTEDLVQINYWLADIDEGDKKSMFVRINSLKLLPTHVVETKRGYHCYWAAESATPEHYEEIERGIARALRADTSLTTPTHTLRYPGYYHLKDPQSPFMVNWFWRHPEITYTEDLMLSAFKLPPRPQIEYECSLELSALVNPDNWIKYLHTDRIVAGNRNNEFNRIAYKLFKNGADYYIMLATLEAINDTLPNPLPEREIQTLVKGKFKNI